MLTASAQTHKTTINIRNFCLCIVVLTTVNAIQYELSDQAREFLARVKMADLPESVQLSLTANQGRNGGVRDASHWCCINEQPVTTVTSTKVQHDMKTVATKTKVGYVSCGFAGTMRCSQFVTHYRHETYTYIQTFQIPNMAACSSHEVKCCSGYLLVAENCHTFNEIKENQSIFSFLAGLGLLTLPGIGK